jgi:flagellar hook protein FlgE
MDPISTARYGMMAATQQLTASASRIAGGAADGDVDYAGEAVSQVEAKLAFRADVGVIKVADEMWQSLLDLQAVRPNGTPA